MRSELRDVGRNAFWVDEIDVFDVDTERGPKIFWIVLTRTCLTVYSNFGNFPITRQNINILRS